MEIGMSAKDDAENSREEGDQRIMDIAVFWLVGHPTMAYHWHMGCQEECRLRAWEGGRCRPGSLALEVGQLLMIHTFWVAIRVVSSVDTTSSTAQQHNMDIALQAVCKGTGKGNSSAGKGLNWSARVQKEAKNANQGGRHS